MAIKSNILNIILEYAVEKKSLYEDNPHSFLTEMPEAYKKNGEKFKLLKNLVEEVDVNQFTITLSGILHCAALSGWLEVVRYLVEQKGANVNEVANYQKTALHEAARMGQLDVAEYLIKKGSGLNPVDIKGNTPLSYASSFGRTAIVELLLTNGADVNEINRVQEAPIQLAAYEGHIETVKLLIKRGANINVETSKLESPLYLATKYGQLEIAQLLIEEGASVNVKSIEKEFTPLYFMFKKNNVGMVRLLLENGADVDATFPGTNKTLLESAISKGWLNMVKLFLKKGANIERYEGLLRQAIGFKNNKLCRGDYKKIAKLLIYYVLFRHQPKEQPALLENIVDLSTHWYEHHKKINFLVNTNFFGKNNNTQNTLELYLSTDSLGGLAVTTFFDNLDLKKIENNCEAAKSVEATVFRLN